jgi:hypothetical protein
MPEKSLAERLQLKNGRSVYIYSPPAGYLDTLEPLPSGVKLALNLNYPVDVLQAFIENRAELEARLESFKAVLKPGGILWVTYRKGTAKVKTDINRDSINTYAAGLGLQGVAIIAVDNEWSALRLKMT